MTRRKIITIIIIFLAVSITIILLPLVFISDSKEAITLGATILSGLGGAGAIIVGLTVYDDIIGKKVLEKKFDTVNSFLEEIKSLQVKIACYTNNNLTLYATIPFEKKSNFINSLKSGEEKIKVAFSVDNYYSAMDKLFRLKSSIHMPTELIDDLNFIGPRVMRQITYEDSSSFAKIIFNEKFNLETDNKTWMEFNDQPLSLKCYIESIGKIIQSLENWVQRNSKATIRMNL